MEREMAIREMARHLLYGVMVHRSIARDNIEGNGDKADVLWEKHFIVLCDTLLRSLQEIETRKGDVGSESDIGLLRIGAILNSLNGDLRALRNAFPETWEAMYEEIGATREGSMIKR